jgi:hypothetical protein
MHKDTANDFSIVKSNFELTARSVCAQTDQSFLFVVVCCSVPEINYQHKNIIYHVVDFPPAEKTGNLTSKRLDKATKLISGLHFIKSYKPHYVFILDADDWLSNTLNAYLHSQADRTGWYISAGFIIDLKSNKSLLKQGLQRFSGSTFATDYLTLMRHIDLNPSLNEHSTKELIIELVSNKILFNLINSHGYIKFFEQFGLHYKRIPFAALAWVRNTGDNNLSDGAISHGLSLNKKLLTNFGLQNHVAFTGAQDSIAVRLRHAILALISFCGSRMPDFSKKWK